ncbi:hypothetical protein [Methanosarcina acetivorans]|jgi:hypothetical protein|uniref:hypothetical protein n=1 Tax=Methanosarcina acetivorans TaxID=2214 RepID=UPI00064F7FE3|nr:hypothetical protein [Methanosarcina acetivorans]
MEKKIQSKTIEMQKKQSKEQIKGRKDNVWNGPAQFLTPEFTALLWSSRIFETDQGSSSSSKSRVRIK